MKLIKILAGLVLIVPLIVIVAGLAITHVIPFLIENGIISGLLYIGLMFVITLVLIVIIMLADFGLKLIEEGKDQ